MRRKSLCFLVLVLLLTGCKREEAEIPQTSAEPALTQPATLPPAETIPEPEDSDLVKVTSYIPDIYQELMYATKYNFTGEKIYEFEDAYLRYGTVKKLMAVNQDLQEMGLALKIWDGYRPVSAQYKLWEAEPNPRFVANPTLGHSSHSRGNTVDLTLVDAQGNELEMPTGFDDFSAWADRDYSDCTETARNNAMILEVLMEKHGFTGYSKEWWHFMDTVSYPVEENFDPSEIE